MHLLTLQNAVVPQQDLQLYPTEQEASANRSKKKQTIANLIFINTGLKFASNERERLVQTLSIMEFWGGKDLTDHLIPTLCPQTVCYNILTHNSHFSNQLQRKTRGKKAKIHVDNAEKRQKQHLESLSRHFAMTEFLHKPHKLISSYTQTDVTGKSLLPFPINPVEVRKDPHFFFTFQKPEELHKSSCEHRNCCDAAQGEQLQIPTRGFDPLGHTRRTQHTPLLHNLFPKGVKSSLDPK